MKLGAHDEGEYLHRHMVQLGVWDTHIGTKDSWGTAWSLGSLWRASMRLAQSAALTDAACRG